MNKTIQFKNSQKNHLLKKTFFLIITILIISCQKDILVEQDKINEKVASLNNEIPNQFGDLLLPIQVSSDFIWGINGHPLTSRAYKVNTGIDIPTQGEMLNELQIDYYRFGIDFAYDGSLLLGQNDIDRIDELISISSSNDFKILPTLKFKRGIDSLTVIQCYNKGKRQAKKFAEDYHNSLNLKYYMIGNERDIGLKDTTIIGDGNLPQHYDQRLMEKVMSYTKGMMDGVKEGSNNDTNVKFILNSSGWKSWGYFQAIKDYYPDVASEYDIIGWQWYSNMANIDTPYNVKQGNIDALEKLYSIHSDKDIWLTEINLHGTSEPIEESHERDIEQVRWINSFISNLDPNINTSNNINALMNIKGYFQYEMLDQPHLPDSIGENQYGLAKKTSLITPNSSELKYKPAWETYKFRIEETKNGYENFAYSTLKYINLIQNPENTRALNFWTSKIRNTRDKDQYLTEFLPQKSYEIFVKSQFDLVFDDQNPQHSDVDWWVNEMKGSLSREDVTKEFFAGPRFWTQSGSNNNGFLLEIFQRLFERSPSNTELNYWNSELNNYPRYVISRRLINSTEYDGKFIDEQYQLIMRRDSDSAAKSYWLNEMANGVTQQELIISFLKSREFWGKGIVDGYKRRTGLPFYRP